MSSWTGVSQFVRLVGCFLDFVCPTGCRSTDGGGIEPVSSGPIFILKSVNALPSAAVIRLVLRPGTVGDVPFGNDTTLAAMSSSWSSSLSSMSSLVSLTCMSSVRVVWVRGLVGGWGGGG